MVMNNHGESFDRFCNKLYVNETSFQPLGIKNVGPAHFEVEYYNIIFGLQKEDNISFSIIYDFIC